MTAVPVPTASGLPLLGSMLELRADAMTTFMRAREQHGDVVRLVAGPPGVRSEFYGVFSASGAQQVLATQAASFRKDNKVYTELRTSIGNGLLTSQDETYLRQRRLVQPLFTHRQVDTYAEVMHEEVQRAAGEWGEVVDVAEECARLALQVVGRILFGADVEEALDVVRRFLPSYADYTARRGLEPRSIPRSWPTPANRRAATAQAELRAVCDRIIAGRRAVDGAAGDDLLGLLTAATADDGLDATEVRDQVLIFLIAGHETTATSLAFALHLLARHPEVQKAARDEATTVLSDRAPTAADLPDLPLLVRVLKESMRLYPAAPMLGRLSVAETVIDGHVIPAGADVVVSPWVTHRHPAYWPEPERFDPDRFLPEREAERPRYAWIPFGGGPRACIGQHFSMVESVLALAIVLRTYELEAIDHEVPLEHGITTRAAGPARCRLRRL